MADPEILKINAGYVLRKKSNRKKTRLPAEVIALLTPDAQAKHIAETDDPMEIDDDPALPGVNPNEDNGTDDGLDELIFVFDDGEVHHLQDEPMDVGLNDLVVDVNEAGDFNIQRQA